MNHCFPPPLSKMNHSKAEWVEKERASRMADQTGSSRFVDYFELYDCISIPLVFCWILPEKATNWQGTIKRSLATLLIRLKKLNTQLRRTFAIHKFLLSLLDFCQRSKVVAILTVSANGENYGYYPINETKRLQTNSTAICVPRTSLLPQTTQFAVQGTALAYVNDRIQK